uniref:DUF2345 domain-containing protein n=1 Tax=Acinetobacter haemolyticus TaxID=29430 RepID=UPI003F562702
GDSINLTTQKNLIAQASQKISLFAAQSGIKQVAGKGKVEIQAQGDGFDVLAKAGIQIISTEDAIYITSPKEIVMKADSSELKLNGSGIFPTTGGKFEVKAGQHLFKGGAKIKTKIPFLPEGTTYNLRYLFTDDEGVPYKNTPYIAIYPNGAEIKGMTDDQGYSSTFFSSEEKDVKIHLELK